MSYIKAWIDENDDSVDDTLTEDIVEELLDAEETKDLLTSFVKGDLGERQLWTALFNLAWITERTVKQKIKEEAV